ncbi:hypothetical protein HBB16_03740 [Pseudonocardia sp. MCCB 268]|nr:hypothetical protein [Pseudonocardia cytotoxica]
MPRTDATRSSATTRRPGCSRSPAASAKLCVASGRRHRRRRRRGRWADAAAYEAWQQAPGRAGHPGILEITRR